MGLRVRWRQNVVETWRERERERERVSIMDYEIKLMQSAII